MTATIFRSTFTTNAKSLIWQTTTNGIFILLFSFFICNKILGKIMGTYLSTPVLEKHTEKGADLADSQTPVRWAVVDMQGWRKSMEDAHVARTDVPLPRPIRASPPPSSTHAKVFAVFDGHGGAEAARFCQTRLVPVLTSHAHWNATTAAGNDKNGTHDQNMAYLIGQALIETFHALDRLIDDPNSRQEIEKWRLEVPPPYVAGQEAAKAEECFVDAAGEEDVQQRRHTIMDPGEVADDAAKLHLLDDGDDESEDSEENATSDDAKASREWGASERGETVGDDEVFEDSLSEEMEDADALDNKDSDGVIHDDSDEEKEESKEEDGGVEDATTSSSEGKGTIFLAANDAVAMFQKMLHNNGPPDADADIGEHDNIGQDATKAEEESDGGGGGGNDGGGKEAEGVVIPTKAQLLNPPTGNVELSASVPTRIQNGRKVCNLPDHQVHAGCTSVVAVIVGSTLVVANAGDSRAVLCRAGGLTEPLSFDHKPLQNREMNRITNAGGFVNQFGRVNGNLNLSRSIGDLKYKQVPGISPAEQMITAEPDILTTSLRAGDEFIVLGCDGIWDCLSNEECVKYVRDRIDSKQPHEIGMEMLDEIVSADPRASQGIGGDNMTIMIIDLLPQSRAYKDG